MANRLSPHNLCFGSLIKDKVNIHHDYMKNLIAYPFSLNLNTSCPYNDRNWMEAFKLV